MELLPAAGLASPRGVSFQAATVYPLDWTRATDSCGGFWTSSCFSTIGFANSASESYDPLGLYPCPVNWYPASECEVRAIFAKAPCSELAGDSMCGRQQSRYLGTNLPQSLYRFGDSGFTRAALNSSATQQVSSIIVASTNSSWAGIVCRQEYGITQRPIDWMYRGDFCGGFRMSGCSNRVFFAASNSNIFNPGARYLCPTGYRWMNSCEAQRAFNGCAEYVYTSIQCPISSGVNKFAATGSTSLRCRWRHRRRARLALRRMSRGGCLRRWVVQKVTRRDSRAGDGVRADGAHGARCYGARMRRRPRRSSKESGG